MTASALLDRIAEPGAVGYVLVNARGERAVAWGLARVLRPSEQRGSQWWRDPQALSGPGRPRVHPPARRGGGEVPPGRHTVMRVPSRRRRASAAKAPVAPPRRSAALPPAPRGP